MNFIEWSKTAETTYTCNVNRNTIRDIYVSPNGTFLCHDLTLPRNPFNNKQSEMTYIAWNIPFDEINKARIQEFGGVLENQSGYCEDGFSWGWFRGDDSLERAFNYAEKYKQEI